MAGARKSLAATLAVVVLILAVASGAGAAKPFGGAFVLHATHGFGVAGLIGAKGSDVELNLFVDRANERANYTVRGTRDGAGFDFDLGALGQVEVEARPTGHMERMRPRCGRPFTLEGSSFVGTIEFHGEEGFTEAHSQATPLRYDLLADLVCGLSIEGEEFGGGILGARLRVARKGGPKLQVNANHRGAAVRYEAQITERRSGLTIDRSVGGHLPGGAFGFSPTLTAASFTPGAPFSGSATYRGFAPQRGTRPAHGAWRGNLTVDFPGHADVPLAGAGFKAAIIHANRTESGP
jgi:hypothetical protein